MMEYLMMFGRRMIDHANMPMLVLRHVFRRSFYVEVRCGGLSSVRAYFLGEGRCGVRAQGNQT